MDLKTFLLARIAEDETDARDAYYEGQTWAPEEEAVVDLSREWDTVMHMPRKRDAVHASNWSPARVLAECAAKRAIVQSWEDPLTLPGWYGERSEGIAESIDDIVRILAAVYSDHEDYRPEWKLAG